MKEQKTFIKFLCTLIILLVTCELAHVICKRLIMKPKYSIICKGGDNHDD